MLRWRMRVGGAKRIRRARRGRATVGCAALAWTLCASPVFANSPSKAEQARVSVREAVGALPPNAALERLAKEGYRLKDPLLLLDAGEEALARATEIEDVEALGRARAHVSVAFDMLAYLQAPRVKSRWVPVETADLTAHIDRADTLLRDIDARIDEIRAARAAALVATAEPPPKTGRGRLVSGAVLTAVGISGAALGLTGALLGRQAQNKIDDPSIYGTTWDEWDTKGRNANLMSFVGAGAAAVGLIVGIPLIVSGTKAKRRAEERSATSSALRILPQPRGLLVTGRF